MNLEIKETPVSELIPYINNARVHPDAQISQIAASIKEFGFNNPVLTDGSKGVIAGHGRLLAAKKLNMKTVPTIELSHLSESQKKAFILADNRLSESGGADWDMDMVNFELEALSADDFDIGLTVFNFAEKAEETEGLTDPDDVPEVPEVPVCKLGDLWLLGDHRVLCGDSTDKVQVERLMNGKKADMVFTDRLDVKYCSLACKYLASVGKPNKKKGKKYPHL